MYLLSCAVTCIGVLGLMSAWSGAARGLLRSALNLMVHYVVLGREAWTAVLLANTFLAGWGGTSEGDCGASGNRWSGGGRHWVTVQSPGVHVESGGIVRGGPTSGASCGKVSVCVTDAVSYCVDEARLGACGNVKVGGGCSRRDLAGVEVGETSGESARGEYVNGAVRCKVCALAETVDLGGAWK